MTGLHRGVVEHTDGVAGGYGKGETIHVAVTKFCAADKGRQGSVNVVANV